MVLETIQTPFHDEVLTSRLEWDTGYLLPPSAPGLGIELNLDVVQAHPASDGGRLHLEMHQQPLSSNNHDL